METVRRGTKVRDRPEIGGEDGWLGIADAANEICERGAGSGLILPQHQNVPQAIGAHGARGMSAFYTAQLLARIAAPACDGFRALGGEVDGRGLQAGVLGQLDGHPGSMLELGSALLGNGL